MKCSRTFLAISGCVAFLALFQPARAFVMGKNSTGYYTNTATGGIIYFTRFQAPAGMTYARYLLFHNPGAATGETVQMVIYDDNAGNPGSFLAAATATVSTASGWNMADLGGNISISETSFYWVGVQFSGSTTSFSFGFDSGTTYSLSTTFPTHPDAIVGTNTFYWTSYALAVYAADIPPTATPTSTPTPTITPTFTYTRTVTPTFTVTPVYTPVAGYILGKDTIGASTSGATLGKLIATRFQTTTSHDVSCISFFNIGGLGDVVYLGIYSENANAPYQPLAQTNGTVLYWNTWITFPLSTPLTLNAGTNYWLALHDISGGTMRFKYDTTGTETTADAGNQAGFMPSPYPLPTFIVPYTISIFASDIYPNSTPTITPSPAATRTASPTASPTKTVSATFTATRTRTGTRTTTVTRTPSASITPTGTISATSTITPTLTPVQTPTPLPNVIAYPMPATGDTLYFAYRLPKSGRVTVDIYNVAGEKVKTLEQNPVPAGYLRLPWTIRDVAPAVYLYRMTVEFADGTKNVSALQKIVVVKK